MNNLKKSVLLALIATFMITSCSDSPTGTDENESEIEVRTIEDLHAPMDRDSDVREYVRFSLRTGEVIAEANADDSNWDIGFAGTDIILNSGIHGEGEAGAFLLDLPFEEVEMAPASGYAGDTEEENAITGWYNYTGQTGSPIHAVLAKEDVTIVVKTADGSHYGKIQIVSYYKGSPDPGTEEFANLQTRPDEQHYTFRYAIQRSEGVRDLK